MKKERISQKISFVALRPDDEEDEDASILCSTSRSDSGICHFQNET